MKLVILKQKRFDKVKDGTMTTWLTINDDFAKSIQIGETFRIMCDETSELVFARCTGFYVYDTFDQLYGKVDINTLGYNKKDSANKELIKDQMFHRCSPEMEKQHGVRGIKFEYVGEYKELEDMTDKELETFFNELINGVINTQRKLMESINGNDRMLDVLTKYIDNNPKLFLACSEQDGAIDTNMFKWLLAENMERTKKLIELIEYHQMEAMHID